MSMPNDRRKVSIVQEPNKPTSQTIDIIAPDDLFDPLDKWGLLYREGLARVNLANKRILELGTGTGVAALQMIYQDMIPPRALYLNDIEPRAIATAKQNLKNVKNDYPDLPIEYITGDAVNVIKNWPLDDEPLDCIIGCLPQVPWSHDSITARQHADYYIQSSHPIFNNWGLGLIHDVKLAALEYWKKVGQAGYLILVHSGRVPDPIREQVDKFTGFHEIKILHETVVKHDKDTALEYLFGTKHTVLFQDKDCNVPLTPEIAEQLRIKFLHGEISEAEYTVYHKVMLIASRPIKRMEQYNPIWDRYVCIDA